MINRDIANRIIQPKNQRVKRCRFCGHKLTLERGIKSVKRGLCFARNVERFTEIRKWCINNG